MFQNIQILHNDQIGLLSCPFLRQMFCDKIFYSSIFFWKQITNCSYHFTTVLQSDRNDANFAPNDPFSTSTSLYLCLWLCSCLCLSLSLTHKWSSCNHCFILSSHELNISEFMCTCLSVPDLFHEWTVTLHIWHMFFIPSYMAGHWLEHTYTALNSITLSLAVQVFLPHQQSC